LQRPGKVGVDGAIFISAFSMYRYDASYAKPRKEIGPEPYTARTSGDRNGFRLEQELFGPAALPPHMRFRGNQEKWNGAARDC
jgi:hypothetical protein